LYERALGGERVNEELSYRLGGVDRTFLVSIQPVWRRGAIVGVSALGRDVTALKETERSLRAAEQRFARIFHVSPAPIVISRPEDGRILDANDAFARMMGYTREELLGRSSVELGIWLDPEARRRTVDEVTRNGGSWGIEIEFRKKSGERVVALGGFVLAEISGQQCLLGIAEDITERKAWEERSRGAARFEAIAQLSSGIAHEFNNLLTVILGGVELLRSDRIPPPARRRTLDKIHAAATKAADLTHQLLAFGRRQPLKPVEIDPDALIADLGELLQKSVGEEIEVRTSLAPDLPLLRIDRARLEQALLALAFNARDAMPHGGILEFRTRLVSRPIERPDDVPSGPLVELAVIDTGVGMSRETLARLFEPFFTTRNRGSGLGLPMVQGVVRQSGGFLRVDSAPGRGTTVSLYFPPAERVWQAEQPPPGEGEAAAPQG